MFDCAPYVCFAFHSRCRLITAGCDNDFCHRAGATWVAVEPLLNQATLNASNVIISPDGTTDDALITYIRAAKSLGLSVMIKV